MGHLDSANASIGRSKNRRLVPQSTQRSRPLLFLLRPLTSSLIRSPTTLSMLVRICSKSARRSRLIDSNDYWPTIQTVRWYNLWWPVSVKDSGLITTGTTSTSSQKRVQSGTRRQKMPRSSGIMPRGRSPAGTGPLSSRNSSPGCTSPSFSRSPRETARRDASSRITQRTASTTVFRPTNRSASSIP